MSPVQSNTDIPVFCLKTELDGFVMGFSSNTVKAAASFQKVIMNLESSMASGAITTRMDSSPPKVTTIAGLSMVFGIFGTKRALKNLLPTTLKVKSVLNITVNRESPILFSSHFEPQLVSAIPLPQR